MNHFLYTLALLVWASIGVSFAQGVQTQQFTVYFAYKDAKVSPKVQAQLKRWIQPVLAKKASLYRLTLAGVADSVGTNANNYDLAQLRARNVEAYLNQLGLTPEHTTLDVLGELPAGNAQEHAKNRRVEITLSWSATPVAVAPPKINTVKTFDDILELFAKLEGKPQAFVVDPTQDTMLIGKQGTGVFIKAKSFFLKGKQAHQPITIYLREYYTYTDMLLANLSTTSHKQLLETGGMVHLKAVQNGQEVHLKSKKAVLLSLPTEQIQPNMQAFNGEVNDQGFINWRMNRRGWVTGSLGGRCPRQKVCWLRRIFSRRSRTRYQRIKARWEQANAAATAYQIREAKVANKNQYILSTNQLGWINCDAFYNAPRPQMANVQLKAKRPFKNTRYFIVLHQYRSIVAGYPGYYYRPSQTQAYTITFGRLPKKQEATLVALQYKEDKVWMTTQSITIGKPIQNNLVFQPHSLNGARLSLQKLLAQKLPNIQQGK